MSKYFITLTDETERALVRRAKKEGRSPEEVAETLLNVMLVPTHKMKVKEQAKAYGELSGLEIATAEKGTDGEV